MKPLGDTNHSDYLASKKQVMIDLNKTIITHDSAISF